jgi:hypothetical protein
VVFMQAESRLMCIENENAFLSERSMVKFTSYVNDKYCPRCHGRSRLAFLYGRSPFNARRLANLMYSKVV